MRARAMPRWTAVAFLATIWGGVSFRPHDARAQEPVSLEDAVASAIEHGPRLAVARADSALAAGELATARAYPNPSFIADYTRDPPRYHGQLEQPLEYPWVRAPRTRSARAGLEAATFQLELERVTVRHDVVVAYATAWAAGLTAELSTETARDGAELLRMARRRRDAGDASDLEVSLAAVTAGQAESAAIGDSLDAVRSLLALQTLMGRPSERVTVTLSDSLTPPTPPVRAASIPLRVAIAEARLRSRESALTAEGRSRLAAPTVRAGAEGHDPAGDTGVLPVLGISIPLPLFDRAQGRILTAAAELERARAEQEAARLESAAAITAAERETTLAIERVERDQRVAEDARRVARMTIVAYREGEMSLPDVLEAQRAARDALRQLVQDRRDSWVATADLELAVTGRVRP